MKGSSLIDSITVLEGTLEYVEGCKLLENNEIVCLDYQSYLVDINLKKYFRE